MDVFQYSQGSLFIEQVDLEEIAAKYGTPCYVYSRAMLEQQFRAFDTAFGQHPHLVCYAVKANSNLAVLNILARLGAGFDIVSGGELARVLRAGGDPQKIVFSGVGKSYTEIKWALEVGIHCFNVESESELHRLNQLAEDMDKVAPISIRVNPDVDANTHPYISTGLKENKFGIAFEQAPDVYAQAAQLPHLKILGIDCHIGSQLTKLQPFVDALQRILSLVKQLEQQLEQQGIDLQHIDIGGGLGVRYADEMPPEPAAYVHAVLAMLGKSHSILIEPGRAIVANAGVLLTQVEYLKTTPAKNFAIVDAAMNDLIRPALYQAWQEIIPVVPREYQDKVCYDVVGPVCETGDFLGKERYLALQEGDILAVRGAGAYGFVMSSNYNTRPRAAELIVEGDQVHLVRQRETVQDLFALETMLPL
jgi:diaminopimelate decarboxylase